MNHYNCNFTCIKDPPGGQSKDQIFTNKIPTSAQEITPGRGTEFGETIFKWVETIQKNSAMVATLTK